MRLIWLPLQASLILGLVPTMPRDSRRGGSWGVVAAMLGAPWGGPSPCRPGSSAAR